MTRQGVGWHATVATVTWALLFGMVGGLAAAPPVSAADSSRWGVESETADGDTHGWFTSDSSYPITVGPIDPTIPGYDPDTILVYGGSPVLALIGPDGAPITAGSYTGVKDLLHVTPGHAGMSYQGPDGTCGGGIGTLDLWTITRDGDGNVTELSADYTFDCDTGAKNRGQVRFHSTRAVTALEDGTSSGQANEAFVGQGAVGQHEQALFHYTNRGDTIVHIGARSLTGADVADFDIVADDCGTSLAVGAACDVTVQFTASRTEIEHATLSFSTDTLLGIRRVRLYGLGVTPTTTTVTGPGGSFVAGDTLTYDGQVSPAPVGGDIGAVRIMFSPAGGGSDREAASGSLAADGSFHIEFIVHQSFPPGVYHVAASYWGGYGGNWTMPSASDPANDVTILAPTEAGISTSLNPALSTVPVTITATVWAGGSTLGGGTLSIVDEFDGSTIASGPVGEVTTGTVEVTRIFATGTHHLVAHYSGFGLWAPSQKAIDQLASPDQAVSASGFAVTPATFYPVKDTYRDTLTVKGTFKEPGTVAVKVVSVATGKTVRSVSLGTVSGAYSWKWDGRNTARALVPAGKYKVVQTLTDTAANRLVSTLYATVSLKKLYWSSATVTLTGRQYAINGKGGGGSVSTASSYSGGLKLSSGSGGWAAASYKFAAKTAAAYGNVTFKVQGRSVGSGKARIGIWYPAMGAYQYTSAYDALRPAGTAYGWYSTVAPGASHHAGGYIRTMVLVDAGYMKATFDVAKVAVTYRYAVLK